jgi:hypothetical protein
MFCKQVNYTYKFIMYDSEPEMLTQKTTPLFSRRSEVLGRQVDN